MRSEPHDGTLFVDKCQINLIMVNYGDIFLGKYWVIDCIKRLVSRLWVGPTRGRAIRPPVKKPRRA